MRLVRINRIYAHVEVDGNLVCSQSACQLAEHIVLLLR